MAYYPDLSVCDYMASEYDGELLAIGWLERGRPYERGPVPSEVVERYDQLIGASPPGVGLLRSYFGLLECSLCEGIGAADGNRDTFVPGTGVVYLCSSLVLHYIEEHDYCPPDEFQEAVLTCPDKETPEYFKKLRANWDRPDLDHGYLQAEQDWAELEAFMKRLRENDPPDPARG